MAVTPLTFFNTLSKKKETFCAIDEHNVKVYSCGPTVYSRPHIGNYRSFLLADTLVATLRYSGYHVKFIQNITDVGHLTGDTDSGEDKIEKEAKSKATLATNIVDRVTREFLDDVRTLHFITPDERPKATEYIEQQIKFVQELEEKGFTYQISDGIYFDTSKIEDYGKLIDLDAEGLKEGARVQVNVEKKNITDFALWKFSPKGEQRQMEWGSPWGVGFPGWHIECSVFVRKLFGFPIDIHTGGIDNAPTHHTNEIAQNEALTGSKSVNYWLHSEHILIDGKKMSKSLGNVYSIPEIVEHKLSPLSFKYLMFQTHYRQQMNFTWEALENAQLAYYSLLKTLERLHADSKKDLRHINEKWSDQFREALSDDLNTPKALAVLWDMLSDDSISADSRIVTALSFDKVFGLDFKATMMIKISVDVHRLARKREEARANKDWTLADSLRSQIEKSGFLIEDMGDTYRIVKKRD